MQQRKNGKMVVTMASNAAPSTVSSSPTLGDVTTTTIVPKKSSENRRSNKPIMEKRRRARINNSLNELKTLILDATKKDPARHSKLEKADILEMTVKHLESLQRQQITMSAVTDPQVVNKFKAGFSECAGEVGRFPGLEPAVRRRLLQHLANCLNSTSTALGTTDLSAANRISLSSGQSSNLQVHIFPPSASPDRVSNSNNSSSAIQNGTGSSSILLSTGSATGSVQLLPTRLPNGDIALVLPNICAAQQQRLSSPPSPSSAASSSSPPPSLTALTTPSRTASTGSAASSSNSPIAFERLSVNGAATTANSSNCHSSSSSVSFSNATALSSEDVCHSPSSSSHSSVYSAPVSPVSAYDSYVRPYSPPSKPLSLVVREEASYYSEEKPWRPW